MHWIFRGHDVCADTGASYIVSGGLLTRSLDMTIGEGQWTDATLRMAVYDCAAQKFEQAPKANTGSAYAWKTAIDHATNAAVQDYLLKLLAPVARS